MSPTESKQAPNQWEAILDYSKTVITLSSALIAFSVTFSDKLSLQEGTRGQTWSLYMLWVVLVFGTLSGVLSGAFAISFLRSGRREMGSIWFANIGIYSLVIAGGLFAWLGASLIQPKSPWGAERAILEARKSVAAAANVTTSAIDVLCLELQQPNQRYLVKLLDVRTGSTYTVGLDSVEHRLIELRRAD